MPPRTTMPKHATQKIATSAKTIKETNQYPKQLTTAPADGVLRAVYLEMLREDAGVFTEAIEAYNLMRNAPPDEHEIEPEETDGIVNRRAPYNPLASPRLGKYRKAGAARNKVADPALKNNPLRGRLVMTLTSTAVLFFVFFQALCYNKVFTAAPMQISRLSSGVGSFHASYDDNKMLGPDDDVLWILGGLNIDRIRNNGEGFRLFWAMWMHAGWIHVAMNVIIQLQFFFMYEPDWGFRKCLLLFWVSGVTGNLVSGVANPCSITVGSSGGLFGLMGAMIPYCIEFWKTIPRPGIILIAMIIVCAASLASGFTANVDNWAHIGGFVGGLCFGLGTIRTLGACRAPKPAKKVAKALTRVLSRKVPAKKGGGVVVGPDGVAKKKVLKTNKVARRVENDLKWNCGKREWFVRVLTFSILAVLWIICFTCIFYKYDYEVPGQVTYGGIIKCCCCNDPMLVNVWRCAHCHYKRGTMEWKDICSPTFAKSKTFNLKPEYQGKSLFEALEFSNLGPDKLFDNSLVGRPQTRPVPELPGNNVDSNVASPRALINSDSGVVDSVHSLLDSTSQSKSLPVINELIDNCKAEELTHELELSAKAKLPSATRQNYSEYFTTPLTDEDVKWLDNQRHLFHQRAAFCKNILQLYLNQ